MPGASDTSATPWSGSNGAGGGCGSRVSRIAVQLVVPSEPTTCRKTRLVGPSAAIGHDSPGGQSTSGAVVPGGTGAAEPASMVSNPPAAAAVHRYTRPLTSSTPSWVLAPGSTSPTHSSCAPSNTASSSASDSRNSRPWTPSNTACSGSTGASKTATSAGS